MARTTEAAAELKDLILRFEIPLPDRQFSQLIATLGEDARRRTQDGATDELNARYFYLIARVYELLGHSALHMPWLSKSPTVYWLKAAGLFERAIPCTASGSAYRDFLQGKHLYRLAMTHRVDSKGSHFSDHNRDQVLGAVEAFRRAAEKERDSALRSIYGDASVLAEIEVRQSELHNEIQMLIQRASSATWPTVIERIQEKVIAFPAVAFSPLSASPTAILLPPQHAVGRARELLAYARVLNDFVAFLRTAPRDQRSRVQPLIKQHDTKIAGLYDDAMTLCEEAGLSIHAAHARVAKLRRTADAALHECRTDFTIMRKKTAAERAELLASTAPLPRPLTSKVLDILADVPPDDRVALPGPVRDALQEADVHVGDDARVLAEAGGKWVISDGFDRYLVQVLEGVPYVLDLSKQPIPFNHNEAARFQSYAQKIEPTCRLYTEVIREINKAIGHAAELYSGLAAQLQVDIAVRDHDLSSLFVTTNSILDEFESYHYPLLSTLRDRVRYAWSLLEMFEMRNGAVRLGTLFSGQCRLILRNPFFDARVDASEDQFLEVGVDPIFETTIEFIFRGAKGEEDRKEFQDQALRTTIKTIDQQIESLLSETRYVDLEPETRAELIARLCCHRSVADALTEFGDVFMTQEPLKMETSEIQQRLATIDQRMTEAEQHFDNSGTHRSRLIDRHALHALREYMKGIGQVLVGMNQQAERSGRWAWTYDAALQHLRRAKEHLSQVGDVDLLPLLPVDPNGNTIRQEYLHYVEARILTVSAWQARYRGHEATNASEFRRSADLFDKAATIYAKELRDYRLYTKASARAAESRSYGENGQDQASRTRRYLLLKEANALFAACGDLQGFNDTRKILQTEYSLEEAGAIVVKRAENEQAMTARSTMLSRETTFGGYQVELIEEGGMGYVYRAIKDNKVCALKRVRDEYVDNDEFILRFLREVGIHKTLNHPNIVRIFDSGEVAGVPYFTMELLEGKTLKSLIVPPRKLMPLEVVQIVKAIAEALDYAHGKQVVHRDLKPSNVMLTADRNVKVMDFGIATAPRFGRITEAGVFVGSFDYAAPEQFRLREATERSDLYSLGLMFYELVTGRRALHWRRRVQEDHPLPSAAASELPREIDQIISDLLRRDPNQRYASAERLLGDLRIFIERD